MTLTHTYPFYDAHMHVYSDKPEDALRIIDTCGIAKAVIMNKGYEKQHPNLEHQQWEETGFNLLRRYPGRFAIFTTVNFGMIDEPDFGSRIANHFAETIRGGASGLKLWLGKPDHHWMALDDPRIGSVYQMAGKLRVPVLIHIGDPAEYWEAVTPDSFWYAVLKDNPHWTFRNKPVPTREQLFAEQRSMLEKYSDTTFIVPHMGGHAENLSYLSELLDTFPNLYIDTTAYEPLLGQDPESTRTFFLQYQDRILVGTDNGWKVTPVEIYRRRIEAIRLFYESDELQADLDEIMPRRPGYTMRGIDLPASVIHKIYHQNVTRLVPGLETHHPF